MKKEDKELLLKDLCARLPYNPIVQILNLERPDKGWSNEFLSLSKLMNMRVFEIKPYLRPISSMTDDEYVQYIRKFKIIHDENRILHWCGAVDALDWLNSHHFDYRGLIKKFLALEAPKGMYELE